MKRGDVAKKTRAKASPKKSATPSGATKSGKTQTSKRANKTASVEDSKRSGPELFIALVGPLGADLQKVEDEIAKCLKLFQYKVKSVRMIRLLHLFPKWEKLKGLTADDERYAKHMTAGNEFCELMERKDALAALAINSVQGYRREEERKHDEPLRGHAFIFHSLKRPEEVQLLRQVYGPALIVMSVYEPRSERLSKLAEKISRSRNQNQSEKYRAKAEELLQRDEAEPENAWGQNIRKTFQLADVFVQIKDTNVGQIDSAIERLLKLVFRYRFHTPTKDEYGMFLAHAASLRSAALGRQVGAAILKNGEAVSLGTNEVPKAFGGTYWEDDRRTGTDQRDYVWQRDVSDEKRANLVENLFEILQSKKWLSATRNKSTMKDLMAEFTPYLRDTLVMDVIEFNRTMHAEMCAIVDAAKRGTPVEGCTLYVTTFPCHECTRHIIGAGIKRVVYIASYPKSLALDLHKDAILIDEAEAAHEKKVSFEPFVGISPRIYSQLFEMNDDRKTKEGNIQDWDATTATPSFADSLWEYRMAETGEVKLLNDQLRSKKLAAARN